MLRGEPMPPMRGYCGRAMQEFQTFNRRSKVMTALGNNVHIFARPYRRQELTWCFETVLGCGPVAPVEHPGMAEPMLLVRFPGADT
jgi:hypothetical protein